MGYYIWRFRRIGPVYWGYTEGLEEGDLEDDG